MGVIKTDKEKGKVWLTYSGVPPVMAGGSVISKFKRPTGLVRQRKKTE